MASYVHIHDEDADLDQFNGSVPLDFHSFTPHDIDIFDIPFLYFDHDLDAQIDIDASDVDDPFHYDNQANFVIDLFQSRVEDSRRTTMNDVAIPETVHNFIFEDFERTGVSDYNNSEVDLDLRLGFGDDSSRSRNSRPMLSGEREGFLFENRASNSDSDYADSLDSLAYASDLRICGFGWDEDDDGTENDVLEAEILSELDVFHPNVDSDLVTGEFDWETVDERDVDTSSLSISHVIPPEGDELQLDLMVDESLGSNLEWQFLLTPNTLERILDFEHEGDEHFSEDLDDLIRTEDYEMLFAQFEENGNSAIGQPPASFAAIQDLPSVIISVSDEYNAICAVCKDLVNVGEKAKQLPCSHNYHEECIVPWLGIRNTCPICRHELPTDDPEYERRRIKRGVPRHNGL